MNTITIKEIGHYEVRWKKHQSYERGGWGGASKLGGGVVSVFA